MFCIWGFPPGPREGLRPFDPPDKYHQTFGHAQPSPLSVRSTTFDPLASTTSPLRRTQPRPTQRAQHQHLA